MFKPVFTITPKIAKYLIELEALKQIIENLPLTPQVLATLRETARLSATHYSTMIEGNRLTQEEIAAVIYKDAHIKGRERDEHEIKGYYAAMGEVQKWTAAKKQITEQLIQQIHALVMAGGKQKVKSTPYRDEQNVIREGGTRRIVYLPPEAQDVPNLMKDLVDWLHQTQEEMPCPLRAAIAHYQFATIHPYYDGNGRTARILATFILYGCDYDLKSIYSLDEYYAKDLPAYYEALTMGPSHNYYMGRAEADITSWIDYFCAGMVKSFRQVRLHASQAQITGQTDKSSILRTLNAQQRSVITLFERQSTITSHDIEKLFAVTSRTARVWCQQWVQEGFLDIRNPSKKARSYILSPALNKLLF